MEGQVGCNLLKVMQVQEKSLFAIHRVSDITTDYNIIKIPEHLTGINSSTISPIHFKVMNLPELQIYRWVRFQGSKLKAY